MRLTSTEPVRRHLDMLRGEAGLGTRRVALLAGVSRSAVEDVRRNAEMFRQTAKAILAVEPTDMLPANLVDPTGANRRMRALAALGWSFRRQASQAGIGLDLYRRYTDAQNIRRSSDALIRDVYERLSMRRPEGRSASWTRSYASRCGWFPPLAWDDDVIDDPDALPCLLPSVGACSRDVELTVQHLAAGHDVTATPAARREIVRRTPDRPAAWVAGVARCSIDRVWALRQQVEATC